MRKFSLIFFVFLSIGIIISLTFQWPTVAMIFKPLLMITLGLYYYSTAHRPTSVVLLAILFSWTGHILSQFDNEHAFFLMGALAAFFVAHIFYILAYRRHQNTSADNALEGLQKIRFSFPIVLAGTGLLIVLYPFLGDLRIPMSLYTLVLIIMVINAVFRYGRTDILSFWIVFIGSVLIMASDSILAINKFIAPVPWSYTWIMVTYIGGQFLIVHGLGKHENQQSF